MAYAEESTDSYVDVPTSASLGVQNNIGIISSINDVEKPDNSFSVEATDITATGAKLSWKNKEVCLSYRICEYDYINSKWTEFVTTPENELSLTDLQPTTTHKYCIINAVTNEILGVTEFTTGIKTPSLTVKDRAGDTVKLALSNVQKGAKVEIYRKAAGEKYKKIATLVSDKKTYTDKSLKGATTYYYKAKAVVTKKLNGKKTTKKSAYSKEKKTKTLLSMGLPAVSGRTKTYAYYTAVTAKSSPQYKLLHSSECYTDRETGVRMVDGCYCVALGSYYGTKIGTKYRITFSTGTKIDVILCDQKADRHTDSRHQYAVSDNDILEFYCEVSKMPSYIRSRGDFGAYEKFSGSVVKIEKYV